MVSSEHEKPHLPLNPESSDELDKFGITRVPVDYFHYKDYRYTNLSDAVAQAKRDRALG